MLRDEMPGQLGLGACFFQTAGMLAKKPRLRADFAQYH
jgi:hypothetical protein